MRNNPFALLDSDPKQPKRNYRGNTIKHLTKTGKGRILKLVNTNRKDDNMVSDKKQKNIMQTVCLLLLALAAGWGVAELLGGGLVDVVVAVLFVTLLTLQALDWRI